MASIEYSIFSSKPVRLLQCELKLMGVDLGVVRGVGTGDAIRLSVVGLITPLMAFTGLILEYVNTWNKKQYLIIIINMHSNLIKLLINFKKWVDLINSGLGALASNQFLFF